MTDQKPNLRQAAIAFAKDCVSGPEWTATWDYPDDPRERKTEDFAFGKLLVAVREWVLDEPELWAHMISERVSHLEAQLAVYDKLIPLLQAKAAVGDAWEQSMYTASFERAEDRDRMNIARSRWRELEKKT